MAGSDVRVIAKGGAIQITGQLMQSGLSFLFVAIAVRILGTADYGLFRQAVQAPAIAGQVGLLGLQLLGDAPRTDGGSATARRTKAASFLRRTDPFHARWSRRARMAS